MKLRGGYVLRLEGRPSGGVEVLPEPRALYLPLASPRFQFREICVKDGERVRPGRVLAKDPKNFGVPLLAPRAGAVRLNAVPGHIALENVEKQAEEPYHPAEDLEHVPKDMGSAGMKRYKLLQLGAWQFFRDAHTGRLPDPMSIPRAVIVTTLRIEPFVARGDVQIRARLRNFTRGLEHLQSLLEYQPIYLIMPDARSALAGRVREVLRGYAYVKLVEVPRKYPYGDFAVLARGLGLKKENGAPVWALETAGVLAIDRALTLSRPSTVRIISLGGPAVGRPRHLAAMPGYPLDQILPTSLKEGAVRVINGGVMTGTALSAEQKGLDAECSGLTAVPENEDREFLGFLRPGLDRKSYSRCFAGAIRGNFEERPTTALRGERRPCVSCSFCEEVCPAGIMPHRIHKLLYQNEIEQVEADRVDLCVECGLCSFVCPSKIELREQMIESKRRIEEELRPSEVSA